MSKKMPHQIANIVIKNLTSQNDFNFKNILDYLKVIEKYQTSQKKRNVYDTMSQREGVDITNVFSIDEGLEMSSSKYNKKAYESKVNEAIEEIKLLSNLIIAFGEHSKTKPEENTENYYLEQAQEAWKEDVEAQQLFKKSCDTYDELADKIKPYLNSQDPIPESLTTEFNDAVLNLLPQGNKKIETAEKLVEKTTALKRMLIAHNYPISAKELKTLDHPETINELMSSRRPFKKEETTPIRNGKRNAKKISR